MKANSVGKTMDQRPIIGKCRCQLWFVVLAAFLLWFLVLCLYHSEFMVGKNPMTWLSNIAYDSVETHQSNLPINPLNVTKKDSNLISKKKNVYEHVSQDNGFATLDQLSFTEEELEKIFKIDHKEDQNSENEKSDEDYNDDDSNGSVPKSRIEPNCTGRNIFMQKIPRGFNTDILRDCRFLSNWTNMCEFIANLGLGPRVTNAEKVYSNTGWFATNQFLSEVIFHNRMKQYDCLTTNPSIASAIFVPYYAGLDVSRYLWGHPVAMRDWGSLQLVKFLRNRPEWKRMRGRDHFFVAGRITWDFRRGRDGDSDWGSKLMLLPEARVMTILTIESSPWNNNDFAIPYPTYFHPSRDRDLLNWQRRMRKQRRRLLFSFAGGPRPDIPNSIRSEIIEQCRAAGKKCGLLECKEGSVKCHKPVLVMKMFQNSVFCLQPPGDSFTRRSAFDSILAGCIPVFFHPGSAYVQYLWHFPKDYTKYSVFISTFEVKNGTLSIKKILSQIPKEEVNAMREEVINLIPRIIYADPSSRLETLEDAFDIAVKGVIDRVNNIRKEMEEGKDSSRNYIEEHTWKYNLFGTTEKHEWDPFFART